MESIRNIEIAPRISPFALLFLWLIVFLVPSGLFLGGLHALIAQDEQLQRGLMEQFLTEEMKQYQDDLHPRRFFEHCASQAALSFSSVYTSSRPFQFLKKWGRSFASDLGARFHFFVIGNQSASICSMLAPRILLENWPQERRRLAVSELFRHHFRKFQNANFKGAASEYPNAAALLVDSYGLYGSMMVHEGKHGKARAIYSSFDPGTSIWFSWFVSLDPMRGSNSWHSLAAIREDDLGIDNRLAFAAHTVVNPGFRRTLAFVGGTQAPRFIVKGGFLWFVDVLPHNIANKILQSRTRLRGGRLPMAAVAVRLSAFAHPFRAILPLIRTALFLVLLIAGLLIFGFARGNQPIGLGIRGKILLAIGVGIWIPLIGTILSLIFYQRLHDRAYANETLDELERYLETTEIKLSGIDSFLGLDLLDVRKRLEGDTKRFSFQRIDRLIHFSGGLPFRVNLLAISADGSESIPEKETLGTAAISGEAQEFVLKIFRGFAIDLLFGLGSVQKYQQDPRKQLKLRNLSDLTQGLGESLIDPNFFNSVMTNPAKLVPLPLSQIFERATAFLIYPGGNRNLPPYALVAITSMVTRRYQEFFKLAGPVEALVKPHTPGYAVKQAFFRFDSRQGLALDGYDFPPDLCKDPELMRIADQCRSENSDLRFDRSRHAQPRLIAARLFREIPYLGAIIAGPTGGKLNLQLTFAVIGIALLLFIGASFGTAALLWRPLKACLAAIRRTAAGRYDWKLDVRSGDELETFADALNDMVSGIRERERMSRFVSDDALAIATADDDSMMHPGGEYRDVTVLTSDIRSFTTLSETHPPEEIVGMLNSYFTRMEACIRANGGTIDRFVGDALTAVFRDDGHADDQALRACSAALEMRRELSALNRERERAGLFTIRTGVGLASGRVIAGRIGSSTGRLDATFIGDAVMLASFVETRSKQAVKSGIVLAPSTVRLLHGRGRLEFLERATPEGKNRAFSLYELIDLRDSGDDGDASPLETL